VSFLPLLLHQLVEELKKNLIAIHILTFKINIFAEKYWFIAESVESAEISQGKPFRVDMIAKLDQQTWTKVFCQEMKGYRKPNPGNCHLTPCSWFHGFIVNRIRHSKHYIDGPLFQFSNPSQHTIDRILNLLDRWKHFKTWKQMLWRKSLS
jgi:hypothetical protein